MSDGVQLVTGSEPTGRAQITQFDPVVSIEDEVLAFDVSMDNALRVQICDRFEHVPEVPSTNRFRQDPAGCGRQQVAQVAVFAEFEDLRDATVDYVIVHQLDDVRVLQLTMELHLKQTL